jgi:hypothetical protein
VARDRFEFHSSHFERGIVAASATTPGCFSDEVAIDFPSVDELVPRVRDRFFGPCPDAGTVTLLVSVSPREAFRGTTVPLEVPLRRTCDLCGGRGETWSEACVACDGSGHAIVRYPVRVSIPAGVIDGARLRVRVSSPLAMPVLVDVCVAIGHSLA